MTAFNILTRVQSPAGKESAAVVLTFRFRLVTPSGYVENVKWTSTSGRNVVQKLSLDVFLKLSGPSSYPQRDGIKYTVI